MLIVNLTNLKNGDMTGCSGEEAVVLVQLLLLLSSMTFELDISIWL